MNYYKRIGETTKGSKPVIQGWIYPGEYRYTINNYYKPVARVMSSNHLWQQVTKEEYIQWAIEKAKELYTAPCRVVNVFNDCEDSIEQPVITFQFEFLCVDNIEVYNLETGEWAEIVSKPDDKDIDVPTIKEEDLKNKIDKHFDKLDANELAKDLEENYGVEIVSKPEEEENALGIKGAKKTMDCFKHDQIEQLKEIPEARKLLEEWGVIERDYVKEVFASDASFETFRNCVENDMMPPYDNLSTENICKALVQYVEGFELDNE